MAKSKAFRVKATAPKHGSVKSIVSKSIDKIDCVFVDASFREIEKEAIIAAIKYDYLGKPTIIIEHMDVENNNEAEMEAIELAVESWPGMTIYTDSTVAVQEYKDKYPVKWISRDGNPAHFHTQKWPKKEELNDKLNDAV